MHIGFLVCSYRSTSYVLDCVLTEEVVLPGLQKYTTGEVYCSEHTDICRVFFMPCHMCCCYTTVIGGHCCILGEFCMSVIPSQFCTNFQTVGSNNRTSGPNVVKSSTNRQRDMDRRIKCSLFTPEWEEHLKVKCVSSKHKFTHPPSDNIL